MSKKLTVKRALQETERIWTQLAKSGDYCKPTEANMNFYHGCPCCEYVDQQGVNNLNGMPCASPSKAAGRETLNLCPMNSVWPKGCEGAGSPYKRWDRNPQPETSPTLRRYHRRRSPPPAREAGGAGGQEEGEGGEVKITHDEQKQMVEWIKNNRAGFSDNTTCFVAAQQSVRGGKEQVKSFSSTVAAYMAKAGLAKQNALATTNGTSPLDSIRAAEAQIKDALRELDAERNRLSNRIKEIDNIEAKYRKIGGDQ